MVDRMSFTQVTHGELLDLLETISAAGESVIIRGDTGNGKSMVVERLAHRKAKRMGRSFFDWDFMNPDLDYEEVRWEFTRNPELLAEKYIFAPYLMASKAPEDGSGLPVPKTGALDWIPDILFHVFSRKEAAGILFLDEFLQAPSMVQRVFSETLYRKRVSGRMLNKHVDVIAASNRDKDKCGTNIMDEHIKARLSHYELLPPTARDWCIWAREVGIDPRIIMVISSQPDLLHQELQHRNSQEDAFPCGRQWQSLSNIIRPVDHVSRKTHFLQLVAGRVGSGAAAKFQAILDHDMSERGPELLANPMLFQTEQWDRRIAFTLWLSHTAKDSEKILDQGCQFLDTVPENDLLDTMVYMMRTNVGKNFAKKIRGTTKYNQLRKVLRNLGELMEV